jgi:hypothetical protein
VTWERFLLQAAVPLTIVLACALAEVRRHLSRDASTGRPMPIAAPQETSGHPAHP